MESFGNSNSVQVAVNIATVVVPDVIVSVSLTFAVVSFFSGFFLSSVSYFSSTSLALHVLSFSLYYGLYGQSFGFPCFDQLAVGQQILPLLFLKSQTLEQCLLHDSVTWA